MSKTCLIAAGGTGGHIYPALAIASALKEIDPQLKIEFVGTAQGLENRLIPREGYKLHHLNVGRLNNNVGIKERFRTLLRLPFGFLRAFYLILFLRPKFVLGVGGFVTGPIVLAGALLRRHAFLWEPNAYPGMANRWLAPFVQECFVVFLDAGKLLRSRRIRQVGMPLRESIEKIHAQSEGQGRVTARRPLRVLIFGGSQGARAINNVIAEMLSSGESWLKDFTFVHQTGPADFSQIKKRYENAGDVVDVQEYLYDMDQRYKWADVVIARAGISTVAELAAVGRTAILIPLPTAADNHQQHNAEILVAEQAAIMILQRDFTAQSCKATLLDLLNFPEKIDQFAKNIQKFHRPRAAQQLAQYLLEASV